VTRTIRGQLPIAIYCEHPDWFRPLFAELDVRGIDYIRLNASCHSFDPAAAGPDFSLFFNRMSASAYLRGNSQAIFFTQSYLAYLETVDIRVINGTRAFALEVSKARQLQLFNSLGLRFPKTRVVNYANEILVAALQIGFPLLLKPNVGGRGGGIVRVDSMEQLQAAIDKASLNLGIDQTALVQEFIPARNGHITRVETLGGKFLYAIDIFTSGRSFNLCPAEICQAESVSAFLEDSTGAAPNPELKVEVCKPSLSTIDEVEKIAAFGGIDVGGVEYMVDDRDGRIVYYDINALSNFVANAPQVLGFDPHARLVDYLEQQKEHV
jgi:Glutathione synthase/Ribosomal protein S6 modification enzyme (glutaminyl transferase)